MADFEVPADLTFNRGPIADPDDFARERGAASWLYLCGEEFAAMDTGHTTAHLTYVTDLRLHELVRTFGRDHARATWDAGLAAMNEIHQIIRRKTSRVSLHGCRLICTLRPGVESRMK